MSSYGNNDEVHPDAPAGGGGPGHFRTPHSAHPLGHHSHVASHSAHFAHQAHLGAEGMESLAEQIHHAAKLNQAAQIMKAHSQMAWDLRLMRRGMRALDNAANKSGSAKAAAKLAELKVAYAEAEAVFRADRAAAGAAGSLLERASQARVAARGLARLKGAAKLKLGESLLNFENTLRGSAIGRGLLTTGRVVSNPNFVRGLVILGAALEGVAGWIDSNAQTTGGRAANAALAAGGGALVMANPMVAGADVILPKGFKVSEVYQGTAGALTAIGEGIAAGDEAAMAIFHERSKAGDYGQLMQSASEAGDFWAEKGLLGGLSEFLEAVKHSIKSQ